MERTAEKKSDDSEREGSNNDFSACVGNADSTTEIIPNSDRLVHMGFTQHRHK
jgi:hypothetical protein